MTKLKVSRFTVVNVTVNLPNNPLIRRYYYN